MANTRDIKSKIRRPPYSTRMSGIPVLSFLKAAAGETSSRLILNSNLFRPRFTFSPHHHTSSSETCLLASNYWRTAAVSIAGPLSTVRYVDLTCRLLGFAFHIRSFPFLPLNCSRISRQFYTIFIFNINTTQNGINNPHSPSNNNRATKNSPLLVNYLPKLASPLFRPSTYPLPGSNNPAPNASFGSSKNSPSPTPSKPSNGTPKPTSQTRPSKNTTPLENPPSSL